VSPERLAVAITEQVYERVCDLSQALGASTVNSWLAILQVVLKAPCASSSYRSWPRMASRDSTPALTSRAAKKSPTRVAALRYRSAPLARANPARDTEQQNSPLLFLRVPGGFRAPTVLNKPFSAISGAIGLGYHFTQRGMRRTFHADARRRGGGHHHAKHLRPPDGAHA
jgi:hypothetical protein